MDWAGCAAVISHHGNHKNFMHSARRVSNRLLIDYMKWVLLCLLFMLTVIFVTPFHVEYLKFYGKSMPEAVSIAIWIPVILLLLINVYIGSKKNFDNK